MLVNVSYFKGYFYFWGITNDVKIVDGKKTIETDLKVLKKIVQNCVISPNYLTKEKEFLVSLPTQDGEIDVTGNSENFSEFYIQAYGIQICGFSALAPSKIKKKFPKKGLYNVHFSNSFILTHLLMRIAGEVIDKNDYYTKVFQTKSNENSFNVSWHMHLTESEKFYIKNIAEKMPAVFFLLENNNKINDFAFIRKLLDAFIQGVIARTQKFDEVARKKTPADEAKIIRALVSEEKNTIEINAQEFDNKKLQQNLIHINEKICEDNFQFIPSIGISLYSKDHNFFKTKVNLYDLKKRKVLTSNELKNIKKQKLYELTKLRKSIKSIKDQLAEEPVFPVSNITKKLTFIKQIQMNTGCHIELPKGMKSISVSPSVDIQIETSQEEQSLFTPEAIANIKWSFLLGDQQVTLEELEELADSKKSHYVKNEVLIPINPTQLQNFLRNIHKVKKQKLTPYDLLRAEVGIGINFDVTSGWLKKIIKKLKGKEAIKELPQPTHLKTPLRPYQICGFSWLVFMRQCGLGACLADDMGLGKTIQTIAYILHIKEKGEQKKPFLLVCPTSLLSNWQRELHVFAPSLKTYIHHGTNREKMIEDVFDIIITSYSLVDKDLKHLKNTVWDAIILDEGQNIKNAETKQTKAVKALKGNHRIILTGTPVENKPSDIWSLMDFANHGLLGSKAWFSKKYSQALSYSQKEEHQDQSKKIALQLKTVVRPFMLRRLKTDKSIIADLPDKIHHKIICSLSIEQTSLYKACVNNMLKQLENSDGIERRGLIFTTLLKLKQICNHPGNFTKKADGESGKMDVLYDLLEDILEANEKALIFTQFKEMGDMLVHFLEEKLKQKVLFLNGSTPARTRGDMVKNFQENNEHKVFVLSLKAGGMGLNLTAANHVVHYDRWWNPAIEDQATSRAHRIGQDKIVSVHTFICEGTIEDRIDMMIQQKISLANNIIGEGEGWITELSNDELKKLLVLKESN